MQDANPPRFRTSNEDMKDLGGHQQARWMPAPSPIHLARLVRLASPVQSADAKLRGQRNGEIRQRYPGSFIPSRHVTLLFRGRCPSLRQSGVPLTIQRSYYYVPRAPNTLSILLQYVVGHGYFPTESNPRPAQTTNSANVSPAPKSCELVVVGRFCSPCPAPAVPHGRLHGFSPRTPSAGRRVEAVTTALTLGLNLAERKGPSINSHCRCDTTDDCPAGRSLAPPRRHIAQLSDITRALYIGRHC